MMMASPPTSRRIFSGVIAGLIAGATALLAQAPPAQQPPRFRSGVELVAIDVEVVGRDGEPVLGLRGDQFEVEIDGRKRPVVSAQFLQQAPRSVFAGRGNQPLTPGSQPPAVRALAGEYTGRIFVLGIDENSFWAGHARAANDAARIFIDRLEPEDYIGLATFPASTVQVTPTREHYKVRDALDKIVGRKSPPMRGTTALSASEVMDITAGDSEVLARVIARECSPADRACPKRVQADVIDMAQDLEIRALVSVSGIRGLLGAMANVQGRKTLVIVSAGITLGDRPGARPNVRGEVAAAGLAAAAANTNLYVLHVDTSFLETFSAQSGGSVTTMMRDSSASESGLAAIAAAAGGQLFGVSTRADDAFDRVLRETSAYYLLAIEPLDSDRDGQTHRVKVKVRQKGVTVRSRSTVVIPKR
ncbi:MAG: hypothetical protein A3H96_20870 [Acidobacteria bacterium RIFCSPLOWO2_02_FULL_67_36]|nr:MAG: hypothetical protein A3H96_20870 [Acidobacteria bacterium RIFCSPLOWO2_02_FULL_67_36]OFW25451.1 MAG: hypothetical protein A3G21_19385 [Acidobacteria bacterium RIFCSPLOWO2_12_FULL_66_21]